MFSESIVSVTSKSISWFVNLFVIEILPKHLAVVHELVGHECIFEGRSRHLRRIERPHCRRSHLVETANERNDLAVGKVGFETVLRTLIVHMRR